VWREYGLQPWRAESFKFSTDPQLEAKVRDVVGLYLNPPDNAATAEALRGGWLRTWAALAGTSSSASRPPPRSPPTQTPQHDAGLADQARIAPHR
jgi:hypothetical protein